MYTRFLNESQLLLAALNSYHKTNGPCIIGDTLQQFITFTAKYLNINFAELENEARTSDNPYELAIFLETWIQEVNVNLPRILSSLEQFGPNAATNLINFANNAAKLIKNVREKTPSSSLISLPTMAEPASPSNLQAMFPTWITPVSSEDSLSTTSSKTGITFRLFIAPNTNDRLDMPTTGHAQLIIAAPNKPPLYLNQYVQEGRKQLLRNAIPSMVENITEALSKLITQPAQHPVEPTFQPANNNVAFTDADAASYQYVKAADIFVDCSSGILDIEAIYTAAEKLITQQPSQHFSTAEILATIRAGNPPYFARSFNASTVMSFFDILDYLIPLATVASQKRVESSPLHEGWPELFYCFSLQLAFLTDDLFTFHLKNQSHTITTRPPLDEWFVFNGDPTFTNFVRHLYFLSLGLSRQSTISLDEAKYFIQQSKFFLLRFNDSAISQQVEKILHSLTPITHKILREQDGFIGSSLKQQLSNQVIKTFEPHIQPNLTAVPSSITLLPNAEFAAEELGSPASEYFSPPNSPKSVYEDALSTPEATPPGSPQISSVTTTPGYTVTHADLAALFFTTHNIHRNHYPAQDKMYQDSVEVRDYWEKVTTDNASSFSHLNRIIKAVKIGLGTDQPISFRQVIIARAAIWELYRLEKTDQNQLPAAGQAKELYIGSRNILRQYLGGAVDVIYFNDKALLTPLHTALGLAGVPNIGNAMAVTELEAAIHKLSPAASPPTPTPPAWWKFWQRAERQQIIYQHDCKKTADLLQNKELSPYVRQQQIAQLIDANKPGPLAFFRQDLRAQYQKTQQQAELILIVQAFTEGYTTEETFWHNLKDHAKRYPQNAPQVSELAEAFKTKYIALTTQTIREEPPAQRKNLLSKAMIPERLLSDSLKASGYTRTSTPKVAAIIETTDKLEQMAENVNNQPPDFKALGKEFCHAKLRATAPHFAYNINLGRRSAPPPADSLSSQIRTH